MIRTIEPRQRERSSESPDAILGIKRDELSPRVRSYADNLAEQIKKKLADMNVRGIEELQEHCSKKNSPVTAENLQQLLELTELFKHTVEKGEIPQEAFSSLRIVVESPTHDIVNPFGEVLAENDVPGEETLDRLEVDLGEILETCKEIYRRKGLVSWIDALPASVAEIISRDPKQQKRFEAYLKEGRIPVFMPPASVQLETMKHMKHTRGTEAQFGHFKPDITANSSVKQAKDGHISWYYIRNLMASRDQSLVMDVPDTWYIVWEKPTQKSECRLKNLVDQKKYIQDEQEKFKRDHNVTTSLIGGMMLAEYLALQIVFPDFVKAYARKKGGVNIQTLGPLDKDTFTRLPGLEEDADIVANAQWDVGLSRLVLSGSSGVPHETAGIRLSVREVIFH